MSRSVLRAALNGLLAIVLSASAQAQWADLEGQILFEGAIPELPVKVKMNDPAAKDGAVCAVTDIPDYRLRINPTGQGVADIFVYIRKAPASVKPELAAVPTTELVIDQKQCQFLPHTAIVRCKQPIRVLSDDSIPHNVHGFTLANPGFNFTVAPNDRTGQLVPVEKANARPELLPIPVKCDIHPHMESYWLITDHPYAAVTDADGKFRIAGLPLGNHTLTIYHSMSGYLWKTIEVTVTKDGASLPLAVKAQMSGTSFMKLVPAN